MTPIIFSGFSPAAAASDLPVRPCPPLLLAPSPWTAIDAKMPSFEEARGLTHGSFTGVRQSISSRLAFGRGGVAGAPIVCTAGCWSTVVSVSDPCHPASVRFRFFERPASSAPRFRRWSEGSCAAGGAGVAGRVAAAGEDLDDDDDYDVVRSDVLASASLGLVADWTTGVCFSACTTAPAIVAAMASGRRSSTGGVFPRAICT